MSLNGKWIAIGTAIVSAVIATVLVISIPSDPYSEGGFLNLDLGTTQEESFVPPMDREPLINALTTLSYDFSARVNSTPLPELIEVLENGTIDIDFAHRDRSVLFGGTTSGNVTILTDGANANYAFEGNVNLMVFMNLGFNALISREHAAIRTSLTGNDFHGITYNTFPQDIQQFGAAIGMERQTMDQMIDAVAGLEMALGEGLPNLDTPLIADARAFVNFLLEFEYEYSTDGDEMTISVILQGDDIGVLLDRIDAAFGRALGLFLPGYDSISNLVESHNVTPDRAVVIFTVSGEHLLHMGAYFHAEELDTNYRGLWVGLRTTAFSEHAETWSFDTSLTEYYDANRAREIRNSTAFWSIHENADLISHQIIASMYDQDNNLLSGMGIMVLWPHEDGAFAISIQDTSSHFGLRGMLYALETGGFHLLFDDMELSPTTTLSLELKAIPGGVVIENVPFINLDQWSPAIMDTIGFVMGLFSS